MICGSLDGWPKTGLHVVAARGPIDRCFNAIAQFSAMAVAFRGGLLCDAWEGSVRALEDGDVSAGKA